jgi:hypothetical protein
MQDRCTVCANVPLGLEIILNTPDGTPRCHGLLESRIGPFGDGVSVGVRYLECLCQTYNRVKIILDTPDGTPR